MEEIDFEEWIKNYKPEPIQYFAGFDETTGIVTKVGPEHAFSDREYKSPIDQELAESLLDGKMSLANCFVDIHSGTVEVTETKTVFKIDDVLHRIVEKKYSNFVKPDIFINYTRENKMLTIQLTEELGGTFILPEEFQPVKKRKFFWAGDTRMDFLITEYNDPNFLYKTVTVTLSELLDSKKQIEIELPEKFSIYTRRIFKNYSIEIL